MTIGYNRLGSNGRLGNQMFQYAGLRGIAANMKFDWVVPYPENYGDSNYGLFDCFKMTNVKPENFGMVSGNSIATGCFHFNEDFFNNCPDNINLHDYFQSEKYFKHIENEIREDFTFKEEVLSPCKEMILQVDNPIALHVRRTDYLTNSENHPPCGIDYYQRALEHFGNDRNVIVFSDDSKWCSEQEVFSDDRFLISENTDNRVDLCLMSLCNDFIIANSSYSWWGAWLSKNKNKKVIAPIQWFGKTGYTKDLDTKDLIPNEWMRI